MQVETMAYTLLLRRVGCSGGVIRLPVPSSTHSIAIRRYQHSALKWATDNPKMAQECLNLPPLPTAPRGAASRQSATHHPHHRLHSLKQIRSLDDYWQWRRWEFPVEDSSEAAELVHAKALASHVLSAPLTLATQLLSPKSDSSSSPRKQQRHQQWCCIGARAEADLPLEYWKEMLVLGMAAAAAENDNDDIPLHLTLDFIGPEIVQRPPVQLEYEQSTLHIRWLFAGKFHEWAAAQQQQPASSTSMAALLISYDAYILMNPGLGHAHLKKDWKPTLDLLLSTRSDAMLEEGQPEGYQQRRPPTILLTAHSQLDAERDAALLTQECSSSQSTTTQRIISYAENPFASRIVYQDPFDAQHMVRPNHYLASLD
jgi:hypothetical protein